MCSTCQGFTPESLLAYYNKTKRYDIRRAERNGVTVRLGDVSDIPVFYRMMLATAAKNGFTARPQQYYAHFLEALGPMARLYLAEKDGVIIACEHHGRAWQPRVAYVRLLRPRLSGRFSE